MYYPRSWRTFGLPPALSLLSWRIISRNTFEAGIADFAFIWESCCIILEYIMDKLKASATKAFLFHLGKKPIGVLFLVCQNHWRILSSKSFHIHCRHTIWHIYFSGTFPFLPYSHTLLVSLSPSHCSLSLSLFLSSLSLSQTIFFFFSFSIFP